MNLEDSGGLFDTLSGLPVHPLVVHFAVVLIPLSALALVVIVLVPRWRATFGWVVLAGLVVGAGAAFVATQSGEALAERVGTPERHAQLGDATAKVAALLVVVAIVWFLLARRRAADATAPERGLGRGLQLLAAIVTIVLALATLGLTVAVGHSGAQAVWSGTITAQGRAPSPSPST